MNIWGGYLKVLMAKFKPWTGRNMGIRRHRAENV